MKLFISILLCFSFFLGYTQKTESQKLIEKYINECGGVENMTKEQTDSLYKIVYRIKPKKEKKRKEYDRFGTKLIYEYDSSKVFGRIDSLVNIIEEKLPYYREENFPHTYLDVINGNPVLKNFYKDNHTRELNYPSFKDLTYEYDGEWNINNDSHATNRKYYFDKKGALKKIWVRHSFADGHAYFDEIGPYSFMLELYLDHDSLIYQKQYEMGIDNLYEMENAITDTVITSFFVDEFYFYKMNCLNNIYYSGNFISINSIDTGNFEKAMQKAKRYYSYGTDGSIRYRISENYIKEYYEYKAGKNDYLHPIGSNR